MTKFIRHWETSMRINISSQYLKFATIGLLLTGLPVAAEHSDTGDSMLDRGRFMITITGCNDCHTAGYIMSGGQVWVDQWLKGATFGWRGAWGTTYGTNLRLFVANMSQDRWVDEARTMRRRPTMPWFNLNLVSEEDLRAMYQFIPSLGEPGEPAPAYMPPDQEPPPYATFPAPPPAPEN